MEIAARATRGHTRIILARSSREPTRSEAVLYEIFNSVGPVGSIRICRDSTTRKSLGYGYVNFHSVSDAERALDTLNYSSIKASASEHPS